MRHFALIVFLAVLALAAVAVGQSQQVSSSSAAIQNSPAAAQVQSGPLIGLPVPAQGKHFNVDPQMNILPRLASGSANTCLKMRKYVFRREDGSDRMRYAGETDCTYLGKVWPKSAQHERPVPAKPGIQRAILRADQP